MPRRSGVTTMPILARLRASAWSIYLLLGLLATAGYFALPSANAQSLAYDVLGLTAVAAMLLGIRLHRPAARLPWYFLALGNALAVGGDLIWTYDQSVRGIATPFPSFADALYLVGTVLLCAGVLLLARAYTVGRDRAAPLDAAIIAIGGLGLIWTFLIGPQWEDSARPLLDRLVAGAYPALDVLILAATVRLALGMGRQTVLVHLLVAALACNFFSDIAYAILLGLGRYATGHPIDAGWLLAYVIQGTIVLHPAMRDRPTTRNTEDLPRSRLTLLAVAGLTGPALLMIATTRGVPINVPAIVGMSAALFLLVLARLRLLARRAQGREAHFRALVQSATDGIAIVDADGVAEYQSPAVAAIIGYTPEVLLGRDIFARVHPDDAALAQQLFADLLSEPGGARAGDLRIRHADGSWRVLEVRGTNLLADPAIGGIVLNYRDVTERLAALAALERERQFSQATLDALSAQVVVLDAHGTILTVNRAWHASATSNGGGITCGIGANYLAACGAEGAVAAAGIRAVTEGRCSEFVLEYPCHGPTAQRWFVLRATHFAGDGPAQVVVAHEEITDRVLAEAAVREREEQFHYLFAHNPHPMWVYDTATLAFLEVNDAALARYGYTRDEFLAMTIADIRPADELMRLRQNLAAQSSVQVSGPWTHRTKEGRAIAVEIASRSLEYAGRQARLVVAQEVTARLAAEAALRDSERD